MEQYGRVEMVKDGKATVVVKRETACGGNCGSCAGCSDTNIRIVAENYFDAKEGDKVVLEMPTKRVLQAALLLYLLPLGLMLASYFVFDVIFQNYVISALLGFVVLFGTFVWLRLLDKKRQASNKYAVQIKRIITDRHI